MPYKTCVIRIKSREHHALNCQQDKNSVKKAIDENGLRKSKHGRCTFSKSLPIHCAKNLTFSGKSVDCFDLKLCLKQTLVSRTNLTMTASKIKNNSLTTVRFHSWKLWPRTISYITILKTLEIVARGVRMTMQYIDLSNFWRRKIDPTFDKTWLKWVKSI